MPHDVDMPELTIKAIVVGAIIGVVFGVAIFRAMRSGTLLETNIVQIIILSRPLEAQENPWLLA